MSNAPRIMGVVNVTPDSFSDGGQFLDAQKAIDHGLSLVEEGADILDIGGESTRPGAPPVSSEEEIDRVLPVIEGLVDCGVPLSIDTRHAQTMQVAIEAGASMINDITALMGDTKSMEVAASFEGPVCLMHMHGEPQSMQDEPQYDDVVEDVLSYLKIRIEACQQEGIKKERLIIDPGIGFGKTLEHNLEILKNLGRFKTLGVPILLGVSRKSFIAKIAGDASVDERLPGSLAAALWGLKEGVDIFRVHDVAETKQAFAVYQAAEES